MSATARHSLGPSPTGARPAPPKMLLLSMLFPLFMALVLPGIYLAAFHDPTPNRMDVEIVGTSQQASQTAMMLQHEQPDALDVSTVATDDQARADVSTLRARVAWNPATGSVYVASAGGRAASVTAQRIITTAAQAQHRSVTVTDLKPLPAEDSGGMSYLYIVIGSVLGGFITAAVVGMVAPRARTAVHVAIIAAMSLISAVVTSFIAYSVYGALTHELAQVVAVAALTAFTVGIFHYGGYRLIGPAMSVVTSTLMVMCGMAASGGPVAIDMLPSFFQWLHPIIPTSAAADAVRRILYFGGYGADRFIPTLFAFLVLGSWMLGISRLKKTTPAAAPPGAGMAPVNEPGTHTGVVVDDAVPATTRLRRQA